MTNMMYKKPIALNSMVFKVADVANTLRSGKEILAQGRGVACVVLTIFASKNKISFLSQY